VKGAAPPKAPAPFPVPASSPRRSLGLRPALASAAYLSLITAVARASGFDLLLFPELAALTTVVVGTPHHPWARSPRLLVLTPLLTGAVGVALASTLAYGPLSVGLVVTISLLLIRALRSSVMPALSAGLLPLALGLQSWHYPVSLLPGTLGLALLESLRQRRRSPLTPESTPAGARTPPQSIDPAAQAAPLALRAVLPSAASEFPPLRRWLAPLVLFLAGALLLVRLLGSPLVFYPPLLVLAWETLARPEHCPWRGRLLAVLAATGSAALIGLLLVRWLGPVPLATLLAVLLVALLLDRLRLTCPPAFAVALLPFVVHSPSADFPLHVLAGTGWLVVVAVVTAALRRRRGG